MVDAEICRWWDALSLARLCCCQSLRWHLSLRLLPRDGIAALALLSGAVGDQEGGSNDSWNDHGGCRGCESDDGDADGACWVHN